MKQLCLLFLALLVGAALAMPAHAVTYAWVGPTGSWSTDTNWDPTGTPGADAGDLANINVGTCTLDSTPANPLGKVFVGGTANGILNVVSGANLQVGVTGANSDYVYVGNAAGVSGAIYQTGGAVTLAKTGTGTMRLAPNATGYGYYALSGSESTLSVVGAPIIGGLGAGVFDLTGGTFTTAGGTYVSNGSNAIGILNITGGSMSLNSATGGLLTGRYAGAFSAVNVSGTGSLSAKYVIDVNNYLSATGVVNLGAVGTGGGTITSYSIRHDSTTGTGIFNFHGGTLIAGDTFEEIIAGTTPALDFITETVAAYVYGEGAVIDTNGNDATIAAPLLAPTGQGIQALQLDFVTGGGSGYFAPPAVKISGGTGTGASAIAHVDLTPGSPTLGQVTGFTITNPGTGYTPEDGVLVELLGGVDTTGFAAGVEGVTLNSGNVSGGLTKNGAGILTLSGTSTYTGATAVNAGGLAVTGSITSDVTVAATASLMGTGTIDGDVDLNGTFSVAYDGDADSVDLLSILGELDLTGGTISFANATSGTLAEGTYVFATYGTLLGNPATEVGMLPNWSIDYLYDYDGGTDNSIALLVGPGTSIPGDTNYDGYVDNTDAAVLAGNWGASVTQGDVTAGDFNDDGVVNAADAAILAANWNPAPPPTEAAGVPEPSTTALFLAGLLGLAAARKRRRA
ncbi:MAG: autotransporter-associated beta strand repeat-containing protein [Pirellulales bacterium]|nr:autotransporter-associated beta strand repeat-containing protein [Pirellulales bacterium]